jgi:hypothetical protein
VKLSVATAEAAPPVGEDVRTLFYKLGDAFSETQVRIDARFDRVDERLDRVEGRLDHVEERLGSLERSTQAGFNRMDGRFEELIGLIRRDELKR